MRTQHCTFSRDIPVHLRHLSTIVQELIIRRTPLSPPRPRTSLPSLNWHQQSSNHISTSSSLVTFNNPSHGNCPLGGYPPGPSQTTFSRKVNGKKLTEKGGTPPPLHGRSVTKNGNFFAENGVFCPKNTVFGPIFNGFFLNGKGGYSPPPFTDGRFQKT